MKILQIAPFGLPIGKSIRYGGIERVVRDLDSQFVREGHESFVVATGDSQVDGTLCPTLPNSSWISQKDKQKGWKYEKDVASYEPKFEEHCGKSLRHILDFEPDIIHDHLGFVRSIAFQNAGKLPPILTTLHGPLNKSNRQRFANLGTKVNGRDVFFNSISQSQKEHFSEIINVPYVVLNALDVGDYPYQEEGEGFIFSMGLISSSKGPDIALDVAKKLKKKIVVAGPIHQFVPEIRDFWETSVKPKLDRVLDGGIAPEQVRTFVRDFKKSDCNSVYIGELNDVQKKEWFKRADAFYLPIRWQEPFGLVMIESMACGTPVIAYSGGAVPEVIQHNKTGYVVSPGDFGSFCSYALKIDQISRRACKQHVESNFAIQRQVKNYLAVYNEIISKVSHQ